MPNRYRTIREKKDRYSKNSYFVNVVYPSIIPTLDDLYIITRIGDRLDLLAYSYYGDEKLWWVISRANPETGRRDSIYCDPGVQLRIPGNINKILQDFERINRVR